MSFSESPNEAPRSFEETIKKLNFRYGFHLPTIQGKYDADSEYVTSKSDIERQCASAIKYLCFKNFDFSNLINELHSYVPRSGPGWMRKPSQEPGTLPSLPRTKPGERTATGLSLEDRRLLLGRLHGLLDDERRLRLDSDFCNRTSKTVAAIATSPREHTPRDAAKRKHPGSRQPTMSPKKQMTIPQMPHFHGIRGTDNDIRGFKSTISSLSTKAQPLARSVDSTTESNALPDIFIRSTTDADGTLTSAQTSFRKSEAEISNCLSKRWGRDAETSVTLTKSCSESLGVSQSETLFDQLCRQSPFIDVDLPHPLAFRNRYEVERLADALCMTPSDLLTGFGREGISSVSDYSQWWEAARIIARKRDKPLPEKSSSAAWDSASESFFKPGRWRKSVYLAGALSFKEKSNDGIFHFKLKPFQLDMSCRFHGKFGPSRFIVVTLPTLTSQRSIPPKAMRESEWAEAVGRWLATDHNFLGRRWKTFFVEADKKRKPDEPARGHKVHLFAVSGAGIPQASVTPIEDFFNWHIPIQRNSRSTDLKLFQRMSLGLSKTQPSVTLKASEFIRLPDPIDHAVMNDGCARMSTTLAQAIARELGLIELPSVFQGRVAGAKGLWMVVPDHEFKGLEERNYCLEVSDSQLKISPHPKDDPLADEEKRTFGVVKHSVLGKPACLNIQLLGILNDRGIPSKVLGELLVAEMKAPYDELNKSQFCPPALLSWFQSIGISPRDEEQIKTVGAMPDEIAEQAIMLTQAGFTPGNNSELRQKVGALLKKHLTSYVDRLSIRVQCSTYLFCIADPYGVLEPNEVHVSFSEVWKDPVTGFRESFVAGQDILVARLPAYLPSDIQKRNAVWKAELHHFKDVIVFPTKGDIPLAQYLSGGDYDGDEPWICWDPNIVKHFTNADLPDMPEKERFLKPCNRQVRDIFPADSKHQLTSQIENFFAGCFAFNLNYPFLGQCSNEHEKVAYFEQGGHSNPRAIILGAVCNYLVDSPKQGYILTRDSFQKLMKKVSPMVRGNPAYKDEAEERRNRLSIVDDLKFGWAGNEKRQILVHFHDNWPKCATKDPTLCGPWVRMRGFAKMGEQTDGLRLVLQQLSNDVEAIANSWAREATKESQRSPEQYKLVVERLFDEFRAIKPKHVTPSSSIPWQLEEAQGTNCSNWSYLRASCLYDSRGCRHVVWKLAGDELCQIKAKAHPGGYRAVVNSVVPALKCNRKTAERFQLRAEDMNLQGTLAYDGVKKTDEMKDGA